MIVITYSFSPFKIHLNAEYFWIFQDTQNFFTMKMPLKLKNYSILYTAFFSSLKQILPIAVLFLVFKPHRARVSAFRTIIFVSSINNTKNFVLSVYLEEIYSSSVRDRNKSYFKPLYLFLCHNYKISLTLKLRISIG